MNNNRRTVTVHNQCGRLQFTYCCKLWTRLRSDSVRGPVYSLTCHLLKHVLWACAGNLYTWSPRQLGLWRVLLYMFRVGVIPGSAMLVLVCTGNVFLCWHFTLIDFFGWHLNTKPQSTMTVKIKSPCSITIWRFNSLRSLQVWHYMYR